MRIFMATRNDNNEQNKADQNKAADVAARTARIVTDEAARVGEQTARAGADIANRGTEAARNAVEAGLNTAAQSFQRVSDQFTKVLGVSGPPAEEHRRGEPDCGCPLCAGLRSGSKRLGTGRPAAGDRRQQAYCRGVAA